MKRCSALCLMLLSVAAIAKDAPPFDPAGDPAAQAVTFLKGSKLTALGGVRRVAISQFRVEFAIENSGKASSSSTAGWTSSRSDITLIGVSDEMRQAITDQLYDRFVTGLAEAGVEVVPYETLSADQNYQSMEHIFRRTQEPVGMQAGKSVFVGAHGTPYYLTNDDKHIGLGTASGGMFHLSSSVKTTEALAWVPEQTQFLFVTPGNGRARVSLDRTILMPADVLTLQDVTTKGEKVTEAVSNVLTGLLAHGGGTSRHYEATANPDAYQSTVTEYGAALEAALIALVQPALSGSAQ